MCWLCLAASILHAHDPGLSALDVRVGGNVIAATLSIAAPDLALLTAGRALDAQTILTELARDAIRLSIDDTTLAIVVDDVAVEGGGARVQLSFSIPRSDRQRRHLSIASDIPTRVARGHRELVVVSGADRVLAEKLLDEKSGPVEIDLEAGAATAARAWHFLTLGIQHILSGYDHLLFLAGLLLAAGTVRQLLVALTAFTAAHSVSLALVVLAGLHAPASIVEPVIAASIAWIGLENLRRRNRHGARWLVVFCFGLIHGFGFAGALDELGFGSSAAETLLALISFNGGVEAGQLAAVAAALPIVWAIRSRPSWAARLLPLCSALIAAAGSYWLVERLR
jgi:hydrogenase/urease accessory protein HupE